MSKWTEQIAEKLEGRTIVAVAYMNDTEAEQMDWMSRPIILKLDDGNYIYPMSDDEGNDGGAMCTTYKDLPTIPVNGG